MNWHYITHGKPGAPALLFLHGFLGTGADWLELCERFGAAAYCILPDLPGHGATAVDETEPVNFDTTAQDFVSLLRQLNLGQVVCIGYSMGGRIVLYTALKYPEYFAALILESASAGLDDESQREGRVALDEKRASTLENEGLERFVDTWYDQSLFASLKSFPNKLLSLKQSRMSHNPRGLARALRGLSLGRQPPLWESLSQLALPVLLLSGALDHKFSGIARQIATQMPSAQWNVMAHAGHNIHLEQPEAFHAAVSKFLGKIIQP